MRLQGESAVGYLRQELRPRETRISVGKAKQFVTVALSVSEGNDVRGKVFKEVDIDTLTAGNGMDVLLQYLDN